MRIQIRLKDIILLLIITIVGVWGGFLMYSFHSEQQKICLNQCREVFDEAQSKDIQQNITSRYVKFDSDKSSNDFLNVLAWGDQYFLIKEDSCRHHLDSIFQAELHQAGLPFQTAIRYTMTGKTTVSKPELNLSQMHLIEEKVYYKKDQSDEDAIWLQSYVSIPNSTLTIDGKKFKVGLGMVICSMLAWLVFLLAGRKNWYVSADPVFAEKTMPKQPDSSLSQKIHITGNYYWNVQNRTLYYKDKKVVLNGLMLSYFELFIQSETHTITYADILSLYGEQSQLSVTTKNKIYQSIGNLKKVLHEMPLKIEAITNVGYRIHFNEEV